MNVSLHLSVSCLHFFFLRWPVDRGVQHQLVEGKRQLSLLFVLILLIFSLSLATSLKARNACLSVLCEQELLPCHIIFCMQEQYYEK